MSIDIDNLVESIEKIMDDYSDVVFQATEEAVTAGEKVLINELKSSSPKSKDGGEYAKAWKSKGKKYKLKRFVGNTKKVKDNQGEIPLSNILEYGTKSPYQGLIKRTYNGAAMKIAQSMIEEIKKKV